MGEYRVALDVYNGPMDLLLYLIRREEVDIYDIPIARITEQYVQYVAVLQHLDPEAVSEFLVLAATLMEIKSRTLLPRPPVEEGEENLEDPRLDLVHQLLEYKKFKDAARNLDEAAEMQAMRFPRSPVLPPKSEEEFELESVDIWDLFDAFNRVLEQTGQRDAVHRVGIDDTPIALHAEDILDSIERAGGSQVFEEIFLGRSKPEMIGLFLALLELIRQRRVRVSQDRAFGTIYVHLLDRTPLDSVTGYEEIDYDEAEETRLHDGAAQSASVQSAGVDSDGETSDLGDLEDEDSEPDADDFVADATLIDERSVDRGDAFEPPKAKSHQVGVPTETTPAESRNDDHDDQETPNAIVTEIGAMGEPEDETE